MSQNQTNTVPVYWCDDPILWSPCILGKPCGICVAHSVNRKMKTPCMKLRPVAPAFYVPVKSALAMVQDGTAERYWFQIPDVSGESGIAKGYECIKLTYSKLAQLRDQSCKTNEDILIRYAAGDRRTRAGMSMWGNICGDLVKWTPEMMAQSQNRVQLFT